MPDAQRLCEHPVGRTAAPPHRLRYAAAGGPTEHKHAEIAWTLAWALVALALSAWMALVPLEGVPHVQDEVVYTFQARQLLHFRLFAPAPEPLAAWPYHFLLDTDAGRTGIFPWGWPALLAMGLALKVPWLVNPLLHAATTLVGSRIAGRFGAAFFAAPLLALSPQLALMGASRMSHVAVAVLALASFGVLTRETRKYDGLWLGAAVGAVALIRPLDALVLGVVLTPALLRRRAYTAAIPLVLALALIGALNLATTGSAVTFAQMAYFDAGLPPSPGDWWRFTPGCNRLGFGADHGCTLTAGSFGHTPAKAWSGVVANVSAAARLWGGHVVVLLVALVSLISAPSRTWTLRVLSTWGLLAAAYGLYWGTGLCFGARFHHLVAPAAVVAIALGLKQAIDRTRLPASTGLVLLLVCAWRLAQVLPELPGYWGVDGRFAAMQQDWDGPDALVLVAAADTAGERRETPQTTGGGITARPYLLRGAWLDTRGPIIFAEYHPELVDRLTARFPDRTPLVYIAHSDREQDVLVPLAAVQPPTPQLADLPLPVEPVVLRRPSPSE